LANNSILINYQSKMAGLITWLCVLTSPIWLIAPAFFLTIAALAMANALLFQHDQIKLLLQMLTLPGIGCILTGAAFVGAASAVSLIASDKRLVATDLGLRLPMFLALSRGFKNNIPWKKIQSMTVQGNLEDAYDKLNLQIFTSESKTYKLKLGAMSPQEAEKLLLAAEMWLPESAKTPLLQSLQQKFSVLALPGRERSHRHLLSDELDSRFTAAAFIPLEPGQVLDSGRLEVVRQIAFGGLSAVYLVQEDKHQICILKESVIPSQSKDQLKQKAFELFRREVELLKRLDHAKIVKVVRAFRDGEREYLLLQYIPGETLRQMVRENGARPQSEVISWATSLTETLSYLHSMDPPILHRDLTPENIIIAGDNLPVIIDFGVANELISNATATLVGKHCYIAPEQFRGQALPQSDIYSLGGTLHYLLTGKDPIPLSQSIPKDIDSSIGQNLSDVVADMTNMDLSARIASASDLKARLKACD